MALGLTPGGAAPIGYRSAGKGQPFRQAEVLGPRVRKMYEDYLRGRGPQSIAKELNDAGHRTTPSRRGGLKEPEGRPFSVMTVTRVLDSAFNAGYVTVDVRRGAPRRVKGLHEPIIDEATWVAYRRERDRCQVRHPKDRQPRWHLGDGLTACGLCGASLMVNSYADPNGQAICTTYKNSRTCAGVWINRVRLETLVALWLGGRVAEWADRVDELTDAAEERDRVAKELDAARADEDRLARGRRDAARLLALGEVDEADYRAAVADADARRAEVAERIVGIETELEALSPGADVSDRIARGTREHTPDCVASCTCGAPPRTAAPVPALDAEELRRESQQPTPSPGSVRTERYAPDRSDHAHRRPAGPPRRRARDRRDRRGPVAMLGSLG